MPRLQAQLAQIPTNSALAQTLAYASDAGAVELAELVASWPAIPQGGASPTETLHEIDPGADKVATNPKLTAPSPAGSPCDGDTLQGRFASDTVSTPNPIPLPVYGCPDVPPGARYTPGPTTPGPYTMVAPPGADPLQA